MGVTDQQWMLNGSQKTLFVHVFHKPMTAKELLVAMRAAGCSTVLKEDVRLLIRKFAKRGLVFCLTPIDLKGRLYYFTEKGRRAVKAAINRPIPALPKRINWRRYAALQRGPVRKLVLMEIGEKIKGKAHPKTATDVRKKMMPSRSIGLGNMIATVHELREMNFIRCVGRTKKKNQPLYLPTISGKRFIELIKSSPFLPISHQSFLKTSAPDSHEEEKQNI